MQPLYLPPMLLLLRECERKTERRNSTILPFIYLSSNHPPHPIVPASFQNHVCMSVFNKNAKGQHFCTSSSFTAYIHTAQKKRHFGSIGFCLSIVNDHVINPGHWTEDMGDGALEPADLYSRDIVVVDVGGGTDFTTLGIVKHVDAKNVTILDQSPHQLAKVKQKELNLIRNFIRFRYISTGRLNLGGKVDVNSVKSKIIEPAIAVTKTFLRYKQAVVLQMEAFWRRNSMVLLGAGGVVMCILLWRIMFGIANTFIGFSESMAKYGFLALSSAIVAFAISVLSIEKRRKNMDF